MVSPGPAGGYRTTSPGLRNMHKCRCPITSWGNPILRVTQTAESQAPLAFPDGMVGEHRLVRPPGPWHPPAPLGSFLTQQQIDQKTHKNKNQNHTNQNNPHKKSKGQGEEPNITASHLGRGMGSGEVVTYASAKVQKEKKKKKEGTGAPDHVEGQCGSGGQHRGLAPGTMRLTHTGLERTRRHRWGPQPEDPDCYYNFAS